MEQAVLQLCGGNVGEYFRYRLQNLRTTRIWFLWTLIVYEELQGHPKHHHGLKLTDLVITVSICLER